MIAARNFAGQVVGVFGLARSGLSAVRALKAGDARVFAWDDKEEARAEAAKNGATIQPWEQWPWDQVKTLILSPGVPFTHPAPHPIIIHGRGHDVELIGDIELFARAIDGAKTTVIAITRPCSQRHASSISPMTRMPRSRAATTDGRSGGTPGLSTTRSARVNVSR